MNNVRICTKRIGWTLFRILFSVILLFYVEIVLAESAKMTTIILINSEPTLVDLDSEGEILKTYISVPDYFSSSRSHESLVRRSINRTRGLSTISQEKTENNVVVEGRENDKNAVNDFVAHTESLSGLIPNTINKPKMSLEKHRQWKEKACKIISNHTGHKRSKIRDYIDYQNSNNELVAVGQMENNTGRPGLIVLRNNKTSLNQKARINRFSSKRHYENSHNAIFTHHSVLKKAV